MRCSKEGASGPLCGPCIWGSFLVGDFGHLAETQTSSEEGLAARGSPAVQTHSHWPRIQIYPSLWPPPEPLVQG